MSWPQHRPAWSGWSDRVVVWGCGSSSTHSHSWHHLRPVGRPFFAVPCWPKYRLWIKWVPSTLCGGVVDTDQCCLWTGTELNGTKRVFSALECRRGPLCSPKLITVKPWTVSILTDSFIWPTRSHVKRITKRVQSELEIPYETISDINIFIASLLKHQKK